MPSQSKIIPPQARKPDESRKAHGERLLTMIARGVITPEQAHEALDEPEDRAACDVEPLPAPCVDNIYCVQGPCATAGFQSPTVFRADWAASPDDDSLNPQRVLMNIHGHALRMNRAHAVNLAANILLSLGPETSHELDRWFEEYFHQIEESKNNA